MNVVWKDYLDDEFEKNEKLSALGRRLELCGRFNRLNIILNYEEQHGYLSKEDWNWLYDHFNLK